MAPRSAAPPQADGRVLASLMSAYSASDRVRTLAVVGNAPLEPDSRRAEQIDAADLVLRVNSFVLDRPGEPPCQGRRADVVVWNRITRATEFVYAGYRRRLYLMAEPMRMHGNREMWPTSWPADLGLVPVPNDVVGTLNDRLGVPWREDRLAPTTGTLACFLARSAFPDAELLLSGFSFLDDPEQTEWRHQWGDSCPVGREHRISAEAALLLGWIEEGRARFLR